MRYAKRGDWTGWRRDLKRRGEWLCAPDCEVQCFGCDSHVMGQCLDTVAENGRLVQDAAWHERQAWMAEQRGDFVTMSFELSDMAAFIARVWRVMPVGECCRALAGPSRY